jgi:hypothetical protein
LPTFLHVPDVAGQADVEHPTQGALAVLKLVAQPPAQLPPVVFASFATDDLGDAVVGDVREDTVLRETVCGFGCCGLVTCFGASTRTLGSEVASPEGVAACNIAVPPGPHSSSTIDEIATDENRMAMSSQIARTTFQTRCPLWRISQSAPISLSLP